MHQLLKVKSIFIICLFFAFVNTSSAQDHGFRFGETTSYRELEMKRYELDTAAVAVVLNEFGEAYFDDGNEFNLLFEYHVKIKILTQQGVEQANVQIPLYKQNGKSEIIRSVKASSFNYENGTMKETKMDDKSVFAENSNKYMDYKKFAIPKVSVGSIIEYQYVLESPFIFNFRSWYFQDDIPKVRSEYWATIPGNYTYNISLKGFFNLSGNENELIRQCFYQGKADCSRFKYTMKEIPAFVEEDYMTAKSNFISAINFELSEVRGFNGSVDRITKEWKDADLELRNDEKFGVQLRRGKDIVDEHVDLAMAGETDPLLKAQKIYDFIKAWYQWDEVFGKYSEFGIKKAFNSRKGNVGDINLSLIAALRYAGLDTEPVILSTRSNGLPIEIHPVLSDFNYVVAKLNLNGKTFLLDATDDFMPFGVIPVRCLNGKGRVLGDKESYWMEIKPSDKSKKISTLNLKLDKDGMIKGSIQHNYYGYDAINQRKEISSFSTEQDYIKDLKNKLDKINVISSELLNVDDFSKPLTEKFTVEINAYDNLNATHFLFSPFVEGRQKSNPFKSNERFYPVDFATPIEETIILTFEYPEEFEVTEIPDKVGLVLPNAGGRYLFFIQNVGNKIMMNNSLSISRTVYSSEEYHDLKELFNRIIQVQNTDLVFKRK